MRDKILKAVEYIRSISEIKPDLGMILGTGLNRVADLVEDRKEISYSDIPGFMESTAPSHKGRLVLGRIGDKQVAVLQGRFHYYEGYQMQEVTFPVRVLAGLGTGCLLVTNAAGSLNPNLLPGDLVIIKDHINFMGTNPLIGKNDERLGERFPSMHDTYNQELRNQVKEIGLKSGIEYHDGVYIAVTGPSFETEAECLMLRNLGADLVGMSTVPEVIVGIHSGMRVLGLSAVTNLGNIFHKEEHSQSDIQYYAGINQAKLEKIIKEIKL